MLLGLRKVCTKIQEQKQKRTKMQWGDEQKDRETGVNGFWWEEKMVKENKEKYTLPYRELPSTSFIT